MSNLPDPITRREIYYNAIANGETDVPDPIMREEIYLKAIAENGGGGGGTGEVTGVKGDAESKYRKGNVNLTPANIGIGNAHVGTVGLVKPDGETTTVDNDGTLHAAVGDSLPTGGTTGQALVKNSDDDKDVKWQNVGGSDLPSGGTTGQVLAKKSNTDGDVEWKNEKSEIPSGGTEGQVLTKNSAHDGDVKWANAGGGTSDYSDLTNKPQINEVTLSGNKTAAELGLATDAAFTGADGSSAGAKGLVPAPAAGDNAKYLKGDGTWGTPSGGSGLPSGGTTGQALVKASDADNDVEWSNVSGGHTIKDNGTALTNRGALNFTDFDVSDDSTNSETDVKAHRLTSAEMTEIMSALPGTPVEGIVYSETEQVIGKWIDGKPLYKKTFNFGALPNNTTKDYSTDLPAATTKVRHYSGVSSNSSMTVFLPYASNASNSCIALLVKYDSVVKLSVVTGNDRTSFTETYVTLFYTKTTDTAQ